MSTLYNPGTRNEVRERFRVARGRYDITICVHSNMDWTCLGCLWGQLERSEYALADYADFVASTRSVAPAGAQRPQDSAVSPSEQKEETQLAEHEA